MPKRYGIVDLISYTLIVIDEVFREDSENFKQAMNGKDKLKWMIAMQNKISSLKKNNTWVLVQKPSHKKLVRCKWIFKLNEGVASNGPTRYKARLMAKGFTQR